MPWLRIIGGVSLQRYRECAINKDIDNCGKCNDYPCARINEVFEKTSSYAQKCKETCSSNDYKRLYKAFFSKKERLDSIHLKHISDFKKGS